MALQQLNQVGGWSFLQTLATPPKPENDAVYVHPLSKRSDFALSQSSLDICTEPLGSETGSDPLAGPDFPKALPPPGRAGPLRARRESAPLPPPIPSIRGVHVERVRDGQRLLMTATPSSTAALEAERLNGRLTLRFAAGPRGMAPDLEQVEGDGHCRYARATTLGRCNEEESRNRELMVYPKSFCVATN